MSRMLETPQSLTLPQIIESSTLFLILVLALVLFFKSSSPLSKYFIPLVCIAATLLRILYWAQYGNEPQFMTPLVSIVASWLS
ncbi:MAG TPA: hypothetical protein VK041_01755 [Opitutales bacterium]|nr:hypothetical protein [Opitutales bacterium]